MTDYILSHHWSLALIGAHYVPYALVAFGVIAFRLLGRRMRLAEILLLLVFFGFVLLEYVQLRLAGTLFVGNNIYGMHRYYGAMAPFLMIFAAKFVASVWWQENDEIRPIGRVAVCLCLAWILGYDNVRKIWNTHTDGTTYDTKVAVENIVPVIKDDYLGLARQPVIRRTTEEYFTGKRPLVSSPYSAAGWMVRGDCCGATGAACPYKEDYLFFPLGGGYGGITNIDVNVYKFVKSVPGGLGTTWMLFRRRTTPGRKH